MGLSVALSPLEVLSSSVKEEMEMERLSGVCVYGVRMGMAWLAGWLAGRLVYWMWKPRATQNQTPTADHIPRPEATTDLFRGRSHKVSRATSYLGHWNLIQEPMDVSRATVLWERGGPFLTRDHKRSFRSHSYQGPQVLGATSYQWPLISTLGATRLSGHNS